MIENAFVTFEGETGRVFRDHRHRQFPIDYWVLQGVGLHPIKSDRSYYGFIQEGYASLQTQDQVDWNLGTSESFSVSADGYITYQGTVILIEVHHERGDYPNTAFKAEIRHTGPLEPVGRLKYIDGCTDSLLIPPVKMGDPCLNHLHFPTGINQTTHTHPSHRIGIVHRGHGQCWTPFGTVDLTPGLVFIIKEWDGKKTRKGLDGEKHPMGSHKFITTDSTLDVIAFHPDSDFGATDVVHPMINRTIVDGIPASQIPNIQT